MLPDTFKTLTISTNISQFKDLLEFIDSHVELENLIIYDEMHPSTTKEKLTKADFIKIINEKNPQKKENLKRKYGYKHQYPN